MEGSSLASATTSLQSCMPPCSLPEGRYRGSLLMAPGLPKPGRWTRRIGGACPSLQAAMKLASSSLGVRGPEVPGNSEHGQSLECIQRPKAEWHGSIGEALNIWCLLSPISSLLCPLPGREVSTHPGAQVAVPEPSQMLITTISHRASSCMSPGWANSWESPEGLGKQLTHPNAPPPFCRTTAPPTLPSTVSLFSLPDKPLLSSS